MAKEAESKEALGKRLAEAIEARMLSVGDFCELMANKNERSTFHRDTLHSWKTGRTEPSYRDGMYACEILKINPVWLFKGKGPMDA